MIKNFLITILLFTSLNSSAQYSTYYGTYNLNEKINLNADIKVSGNINKTITSIDYGALATANAQKEANRIKLLQFNTELEKQQSLEIASNPLKAFDYGREISYSLNGKPYGFKKMDLFIREPHNSLFTNVGFIGKYRNVSDKNIVTEISISPLINPVAMDIVEDKDMYLRILENVEEFQKMQQFNIGQVYTDKLYFPNKSFLHKKELKKASIFGIDGYKSVLIYENDYENIIDETYIAVYNGIIYWASVMYKGDKEEISFEDLEGRRYYLKKFCEQTIAAAKYNYIIKK